MKPLPAVPPPLTALVARPTMYGVVLEHSTEMLLLLASAALPTAVLAATLPKSMSEPEPAVTEQADRMLILTWKVAVGAVAAVAVKAKPVTAITAAASRAFLNMVGLSE